VSLSIREQALAWVATQLGTIAGATVTRNATTPIEGTALNLLDGGHEIDGEQNPFIDLVTLNFDVECFVPCASDAAIGPAVSDLAAKVRKTLVQGGGIAPVGGLAQDIRNTGMSEPELIRERGRASGAGFVLAFAIVLFERRGDPYALGP
jgi:hypothetical protein